MIIIIIISNRSVSVWKPSWVCARKGIRADQPWPTSRRSIRSWRSCRWPRMSPYFPTLQRTDMVLGLWSARSVRSARYASVVPAGSETSGRRHLLEAFMALPPARPLDTHEIARWDFPQICDVFQMTQLAIMHTQTYTNTVPKTMWQTLWQTFYFYFRILWLLLHVLVYLSGGGGIW